MVAMNAEQLGGFYITMKKIGDYCFTSGKEWCLWIIQKLKEYYFRFKAYLIDRYKAYFIRKDLSKDEL